MRIIVNRLAMLGHRTGIGHYTAALLDALANLAAPDEISAYPTGLIWKMMRAQEAYRDHGRPGQGAGWRALRWSPVGLLGRIWAPPHITDVLRGRVQPWKSRLFQTYCRKNKVELYHEPNILTMPCDLPTIATLHDLSAIIHPEWHPPERMEDYRRHLDRTLAQCAHFITGTDFTRREIIKQLGVAPERVTRIYHGIRRGLEPLPRDVVAAGLRALGLPPSYLLYVGTLEPRKNLQMLLKAYCALPDTLRRRCPLLLVGKWGWNTSALAELLDREARHRGVTHLGYLAEEHLSLLYNGARALVFPSLYEGFGLPPLEMMACGGAVLASDVGAVTEVLGGHGEQIHPDNEAGWREAMSLAISDDDWLQTLQRGARDWAAAFTWQRCAADTRRTYRQVLAGGSPTGVTRKGQPAPAPQLR